MVRNEIVIKFIKELVEKYSTVLELGREESDALCGPQIQQDESCNEETKLNICSDEKEVY